MGGSAKWADRAFDSASAYGRAPANELFADRVLSAEMKEFVLLPRNSSGASESLPFSPIKCEPPTSLRFGMYRPAHSRRTLPFAKGRFRLASPGLQTDHQSAYRSRHGDFLY